MILFLFAIKYVIKIMSQCFLTMYNIFSYLICCLEANFKKLTKSRLRYLDCIVYSSLVISVTLPLSITVPCSLFRTEPKSLYGSLWVMNCFLSYNPQLKRHNPLANPSLFPWKYILSQYIPWFPNFRHLHLRVHLTRRRI